MKKYGAEGVQLHALLVLVLYEGEWPGSRQGHFTTPFLPPDANLTGGWMGPSVTPDLWEKNVSALTESQTKFVRSSIL
jgi:hypothetical protein